MKDELKKEFDIIHELIQKYNTVEFNPTEYPKNVFLSVLTGIFAKCVEFNHYILNKDKEGSFFLLSTLRSLTEELIAMKFIIEKVKNKDELVSNYAHKNCYDKIIAQQNFFKQIKSNQPIMNEALAPDLLKKSSENLKKTLQELGLNKEREFPTVAHMAIDSKLKQLYEYLYSATSSHVHFNPHITLRTGWSTNLDEKPTKHKFSTNNFNHYYENFVIYYASFLFLEMIKAFEKNLNLSPEFIKLGKNIKKILDNVDRIPELVTFEEFNIRRGIYFTLSGMGLEHLNKKDNSQ